MGDVDGDGTADLWLSAPREGTFSRGERGTVWLVKGPFSGAIDLATDADATFRGTTDDNAGADVAGAGDVDGDGLPDLLAGAPYEGAGGAAYLIAAVNGALPVQTLLLGGVIVGIFFASATTVLTSLVDINRLGGIVHWLIGNISPIPPGPLAVFAGLAGLGFALILGQARQLNVLALGEEAALQLGVHAERLKLRVFLGSALLTASVVAFAGPIGFVGLVVPHVLRLAQAILESRPHPEQGYRSCLGLVRLAKAYGPPRTDAACRRALAVGAQSYRNVAAILKNGLDRVPLDEPADTPNPGPVHHENVRGPEYYR